MSDELVPAQETVLQQPEPTSLKQFLESTPPAVEVEVSDSIRNMKNGMHGNTSYYYDLPEIQIHCSTEVCDGIRFFRADQDYLWFDPNCPKPHFLLYTCRNCGKTTKLYAINKPASEKKPRTVLKIGEHPSFGLSTPPRVIALIGPDRDNFFKGRRSENQGLGIGAFSYYRRIVENQKDRIFDELIRACTKLGAADIAKELTDAKKETHFTRAVDSMKHGLPETLLIDGQHNPLILLHSALSGGLHNETDEECLNLAQHVRVVLTELADRVSQVLNKRSELDSAVAKLMKHESTRKR